MDRSHHGHRQEPEQRRLPDQRPALGDAHGHQTGMLVAVTPDGQRAMRSPGQCSEARRSWSSRSPSSFFLVLLMGVVDFGMAVYKFNGVSQAAREIARVTSVHPCVVRTLSRATRGTPPARRRRQWLATQKGLVPALSYPAYSCVDEPGAPVAPVPATSASTPSRSQSRLHIGPVTPLLGLIGTWTMKGSSSAQYSLSRAARPDHGAVRARPGGDRGRCRSRDRRRFRFAQRRSEQNAADLAAFAGATPCSMARTPPRPALSMARTTATSTGWVASTSTSSLAQDRHGRDRRPAPELLRRRRGPRDVAGRRDRDRADGHPDQVHRRRAVHPQPEVFDPVTGLPFEIYTQTTDFRRPTGRAATARWRS